MPGLLARGRAWFKMRRSRLALIVVVVLLVLHVMHRAAVSLAEGTPIVADELAFDLRMFIPLMIVSIAVTVIGEITARRFDSIVKALPLGIAIFRWRLLPTALSFVLRLRGRRCCVSPGCHAARGSAQRQRQSVNCKPRLRHQSKLLAFRPIRDGKRRHICCLG